MTIWFPLAVTLAAAIGIAFLALAILTPPTK